jgi:trk system potassium uptake protein TrkA
MRVIIVGAGQVGSSIAETLDADHEVTVIDTDDERVDALTYSLDVIAIKGNGTSLSTLREAGIEQTDLLIASTDDDETNIVVCGTAKTVSDAFTIARVRRVDYLETWQGTETAFGVDFLVSTNLLVAETVVRVMGLPATRDVDVFVSGRVLMAEFRIPAASSIAGLTITEADRFEELTFAALIRSEELVIPDGDTVIDEDDRLVVIGSPESVRGFAAVLAPDDASENEDIIIVGGGEIAAQSARLLEERDFHPRLIETDETRARELAENLPKTTVMNSDPTDREFLQRERIGEADVLFAALDGDDRNLLISVLAKRLGVARTIAVTESGEHGDLFEAVGVDGAVNPRDATAEEIVRFTLECRAANVAMVAHDRAEVLEIEVDTESMLANRPIRDAAADLPARVTIGAIDRDETFITPRGETVIEPGDHVVVFADTDVIEIIAERV